MSADHYMHTPHAELHAHSQHPSMQATPRTGWGRSGVAKPESIADHMYRMSMFALTAAGTEYNQNKLVKMALVHDIAEAIVGDIAPSDNISKEDKHEREAAALNDIVAMLGPDTAAAQETSQLWCVLVSRWSCQSCIQIKMHRLISMVPMQPYN